MHFICTFKSNQKEPDTKPKGNHNNPKDTTPHKQYDTTKSTEKPHTTEAMSTIIDTQKIKAVALFILQQTGQISFIHLWKILYFAEMKHISRYGRPITDDIYVAMPKGPVPSILCDAKNRNGYSEISSSLEIAGYNIKGTENPDMDELSVSDIKCLTESIHENLNKSPGELSLQSHGTAYKNARAKNLNKKNNPIDWIDVAVEAGAPTGMIEYILEVQDIHRLLANDSQFC